MHIWYLAVCDEHKQMIDVIVNNPKRTMHYLGTDGRNQRINDWLSEHYGCKLRLIHDDISLGECYDMGYTSINVLNLE